MSNSSIGGSATPTRDEILGDQYGSDPRTIKRWRARGKKVGEATPFDNPDEMLGWWQRWMKQKPPLGVMQAVKNHRAKLAAAPPAPPAVTPALEGRAVKPKRGAPPPSAGMQPEQMDFDGGGFQVGTEHTLARLLKLELELHRFATDPGQAAPYLATVARIGPAAKALREEQLSLGKLIPREMAEKLIHDFHVPLEREFRLLIRVMAGIMQVAVTPQLEDAWHRECDKLERRFKEEVFAL